MDKRVLIDDIRDTALLMRRHYGWSVGIPVTVDLPSGTEVSQEDVDTLAGEGIYLFQGGQQITPSD